MADQTIAKNLHRIRRSVQISQAELAQQAGISRKAYNSIEKGDALPRMDTLHALAQALDVPIRDLVEPIEDLKKVRFRSKKAIRNRESILIDVSRWLSDFRQLEDLLESPLPYKLGHIGSLVQKITPQKRPVEAANALREHLGLGNEPIRDIYGLLESVGIKVLMTQLANDDFFGLSVAQEEGGPAIVVNTWERISVERWIFTAAHELGHLLLHDDAYDITDNSERDDEEKEANLFAAYFLMPSELFQSEWAETYGLGLVDRVLKVKRIFRVSYRTVLYRLVEENHASRSVWKKFQDEFKRQYGKTLFRTDEPEALAANDFNATFPESRRAGEPENLSPLDFVGDRQKKLVRYAIEQERITLSRAAEILHLSLREMRALSASWVS